MRLDAAPHNFDHILERLRAGLPLKIGVLGASVAMEGGCQERYQPHLRCADFDGRHPNARRAFQKQFQRPTARGFMLRALDVLNASWPNAEHRIYNAAADGWTAPAQEACLLSGLPMDIDLVFMEFSSIYTDVSAQHAAAERILRRVLRFPSVPAVIMLQVSAWCDKTPSSSPHRTHNDVVEWLKTWERWERPFEMMCLTYGIQCISLRAALVDDVLARRPGFLLGDLAADCAHPSDSTFGAQYLGDIVAHHLNASIWRAGSARSLQPTPARVLRPPVLQRKNSKSGARSWADKKTDQTTWRCYQLPHRPDRPLVGNVSWECQGGVCGDWSLQNPLYGKLNKEPLEDWQLAKWERNNDAKKMMRWYPLALQGQSVAKPDLLGCPALRDCVLARGRGASAVNGHRDVDQRFRQCLSGREHWQYCSRTIALRSVRKPGLVSFVPGATLVVELDTTVPSATGSGVAQVHYLASYDGMGRARISCVSGCTCASHIVDALQEQNTSVAVVDQFPVSPSPACRLHIVNLGSATGELAKWKLLSVSVQYTLEHPRARRR